MNKPKLSFWQIWNMSFGFLGIQFGFALQGGFMSRIFQTLGAGKDEIPLLWIAAPLTGLLVQPIIGYMSDKTWSKKWGRRRPYFLIGAILSSLTLFFVPHSPVLWIAAGFLWILDAMQTLPIYRIRDGYEKLHRNRETFEICYRLLKNKNNLMIFSEGKHHDKYFLLPISKGSSRIGLESLKKFPKCQKFMEFRL